MPNIRQNVWELGADWADPILWYARGVAEMKQRSMDEPSSWRFYAGMHGFNASLWELLGYLKAGESLPSSALQAQYWRQCQHGSWYFLPWHRGYLLAFEATVRAAVVALGGPATWALPYWNYFKTGQDALPPAFASPNWPDGTGDNPLFVVPRYGPDGDGNVFVPVAEVNLQAMNDPAYTGVSIGGSPGFGGVDTGFSHNGAVHGGIETQPHDWVHGLVGGAKDNDSHFPGAMSVPASAALDPIFWLHHANIDRLWQSWNAAASTPPHTDPTETTWLEGPPSVGQRGFAMPMPDGSSWSYTPRDMMDLAALGYGYDDLTPGIALPSATVQDRMVMLGISAGREGAETVSGENVELIGANDTAVPVIGERVRSHVQLDSQMRGKVADSLSRTELDLDAEFAPDRVLLNLEGVRGQSDTVPFHVYVGLPEGADPAGHPELLAGSIAPFGLTEASRSDSDQGGGGLTFVLEITHIVDRLHAEGSFDVDTLEVTIVPVHAVTEEDNVSIGRISIFRQGR